MQNTAEQTKERFFVQTITKGKPISSDDVYDLLDQIYALPLSERLNYRQDYGGDLVFWVIKETEKWGIDEYNYYSLFKKGELIQSKGESTLKDPKFLFRILPDVNGVYYIIVESEGKQYAIKSKTK